MKKTFTLLLTLATVGVFAQNSLLQNPTTGALFTGTGGITDIEMISNGTDVVLLAANNLNNEFYAIDIEDNNPNDAPANTVTTIPNFQALLDGATGSNSNIINIEVNPISKAVYVLVYAPNAANSQIVKIENNGSTVSLLDYSNLTFSKIVWNGNGNYEQQDMTYGNGTLYITSGTYSLDGEIAWVDAPFAHNATTTSRATTAYKTNWGGQYFTTAPLERLAFAEMNGEERLIGVTVCAPGFSIETSTLAGSGLLQVTEDFNVRYSPPVKVVHQKQDGKDWLFDLHSASNILIRIGEKYLDGSQVTNNEFNNNTDFLRTTSGSVTNGMTDEEVKIYNPTYDMISFWDNWNLLVLENDVLKLFQTATTTGIGEDTLENGISVFPNPATEEVQIQLGAAPKNATAKIYNIAGSELINKTIDQNSFVNVSELSTGVYILTVFDEGEKIFTDKLIIE